MDTVPPLLVLLVVLGASSVALAWIRTGGGYLLRSAARGAGVAHPGEALARRVVARLRRRLTAAGAGTVLGSLLAWSLVPAGLGAGEIDLDVPVLLGGAFLGWAAGAGLATVLSSRQPVGDGPRLARGREVSLADYVGRAERWSTVGACVLAPVVAPVTLLLVAVDVLGAPPVVLGLVVAAGAVPPLLLGGALTAARGVLGLPQRAGSALELAWDDVLRAGSLRDLLAAPSYAGLMGSVLVVGHVATTLPATLAPAAVSVLVAGVMAGVMVLLLVGAAVVGASRPTSHVLRTLWSDRSAARAGTRDARPADVDGPAGARR